MPVHKRPALEVVLIPSELADFLPAQAVSVGDKDNCRVAVTVAVCSSRRHQLLHFTGRQIFPRSDLAVGLSLRNCPFFNVWGLAWHGEKTVV